MIKKLTSTLAGAFIFITAVNLFSRGLGFFREILLANYFGRGIEYDVYLVGAVIPITINTVIIYIGQNYFIPAYHKVKASDSRSTQKFFNLNFIVFVVIGIVITLLLYFFSDAIIGAYLKTNDESIRKITVTIFRLFLITIPLNFAISILTAYEQAEYEFKYPALGRLFLNIIIIPMLIIFTDQFGIYTIPIGFVIGTVFQLLYLIIKGKFQLRTWSFSGAIDKNILALFDITLLSIILIEIIGQVYILSDRYFFYRVEQGGISALSYAFNLYNLPISVVSLALATVIFPKFSENIHKGDFGNFQKNINDVININLLIFIPVAFILFFYGDVIISVLFERGKFLSHDTSATFLALKAYVISIIFYSSYAVANKIIYSARLVQTLLLITVAGILLKIVLNFLLVNAYQQNGLALATSISFMFFFVAGFIVIQIKLPVDIIKIFIKGFLFYFANGIIAFVLADILISGLNDTVLEGILKIVFFSTVFLLNIKITKHSSLLLLSDLLNLFKSLKVKNSS